jgi:dTDP-4-dehydrorhamnose reductase
MFLVVGGDSEIGAATVQYLKKRGLPVVATTRRPDHVTADTQLLDLSRPLKDWEPVQGVTAACICAGIPRMAACQSDPEGSSHVNVVQTLALTERLLARGIYVLFLSTNQVFDGTAPNVPAEAPTNPVSEYGRQKARTEAALREHIDRGAPVALLRLAKVVSRNIPLIRGWIDSLRAQQPIRAFHDMTMAPVPTELVCMAIADLLTERAPGIFQLTGPRDAPYEAIGRYVAERVGAPRSLVEGVSALSVGMPVGATPRYTTLDSTALSTRYGLEPPDIWEVIDTVISESG